MWKNKVNFFFHPFLALYILAKNKRPSHLMTMQLYLEFPQKKMALGGKSQRQWS